MRLGPISLSLLAVIIGHASGQDQKPLAGETGPAANPSFTVRQQPHDLCDTDSRQWTGTVNVTADKSMFFWYFESRNNPKTDPLLLWMSGGPGAAGEMGLFMGSGPCIVNPDGNSTKRLDYSWTDRANVVYIDQPVGVGFSKITDRGDIAVSLKQGARDVYTFLDAFLHDVFPDLAGRPWHITGESMGGHYVTGYTQYIVSEERKNAMHGIEPRINISSAIILDGYIDATQQIVGYYDFFCTDWAADGRKAPLMNERQCSDMAAAIPECEKMAARCRESYDIPTCRAANEVCEETIGEHFLDGVVPGGWDPYDDRHPCEIPPLCSNLDHGPTWKFLNRRWVQDKLGFSRFPFDLIDMDTSRRWDMAQNIHLPVTRELTSILDETDIRVLFINGNNDIIINTPGQMRMLDEQPWKGRDNYRSLGYKAWYYKDGELTSDADGWNVTKGGFWKGNDQLSFFAVDEAGHLSAHHQPEAIGAVVRAWLRDE
ncbi:Carboxypeptidase Y like protein A [Fusarium austroafricanum]|uniref:Carboxypeptidase Y like protein A n=1 Tax=Fusarium austroafricanum TaxID=2364996 RepID=A0A8H4P0I8_9HYPO|nr:Carboxypeptidase Y like protein A [Fusarium austroafricanum]